MRASRLRGLKKDEASCEAGPDWRLSMTLVPGAAIAALIPLLRRRTRNRSRRHARGRAPWTRAAHPHSLRKFCTRVHCGFGLDPCCPERDVRRQARSKRGQELRRVSRRTAPSIEEHDRMRLRPCRVCHNDCLCDRYIQEAQG